MNLTEHEKPRTATALEIEDVGVTFGGLQALKGLSISVGKGEIRGLIGPNGAGKSTLVNVIAGEQRQHAGSVSMLGQPFTGLRAHQRARLGLARTFQKPEISVRLTMRENLELGLNIRKRDSAKVAGDLESIVDHFDLSSWLDVTGSEVPYPVVKIIDTIRAVLMRPVVLLADEPAAGLPKEDREKLVKILRFARDTMDTTVVLIEHDVPLVFELCERISVLDSGVLIADGDKDYVRNHSEVIDAYLGVGS